MREFGAIHLTATSGTEAIYVPSWVQKVININLFHKFYFVKKVLLFILFIPMAMEVARGIHHIDQRACHVSLFNISTKKFSKIVYELFQIVKTWQILYCHPLHFCIQLAVLIPYLQVVLQFAKFFVGEVGRFRTIWRSPWGPRSPESSSTRRRWPLESRPGGTTSSSGSKLGNVPRKQQDAIFVLVFLHPPHHAEW